jgi:hypothetical protein
MFDAYAPAAARAANASLAVPEAVTVAAAVVTVGEWEAVMTVAGREAAGMEVAARVVVGADAAAVAMQLDVGLEASPILGVTLTDEQSEVARMRYEYASAPINAAREAAIQFRNQWRNLI